MRKLLGAVLVLGGAVLLGGCAPEAGQQDPVGTLLPAPGSPGAAPPAPGSPGASFRPLFDPTNSVIPFPSDLLFTGSTDGTLNIPVADPADFSDPQVALNALDGFSTIAPMRVGFSGEIDPATVAGNVRLFEIGAMGLVELTVNQDFFAARSSIDPTGKTLAIVPLRPLKPATTHLVAITNGVQNAAGDPAVADTTYRLARLRTPVRRESLERLRQAVNAQDDLLTLLEPGPPSLADRTVLAWTFKTQSIGTVLAQARTQAGSDPDVASVISPTSIGTTATLLTGALGRADVYAGTITLPYYLTAAGGANDPGPLQGFWQGAGGSPLTALNPAPVKTGNQTIPMLVTVPNANSGRMRPADGWPVVMYQHGITNDRSTVLTIADALATAGFAVVAIDMPLHGLPPGHPLRAATDAMGAQERTFDLDLATPDSDGIGNVAGPDGNVESSGTHFINLQSLLTTRDNSRQAVADLFAVRAQIPSMDYDGGGPDFDAANVRFAGWSWGGIAGTPFLALETGVGAAVLAMPGGGFAKLADGSGSFGPLITDGLEDAGGPVRGDPVTGGDYESFLGAAQTIMDSADPLNYAVAAAAGRGVMMFEVIGDATVPNSVGTFPTFADTPPGVVVPSPTAGTGPLRRQMGLVQVTGTALGPPANGASSETSPLLRFSAGYHGSFVDPVLDPRANALVTQLMQSAMASHLFSNGMGFDADPTDTLPIATVVADN